ncbi:MAG TPA: hypothetical protein VFA44_07025 [Gaiellaceae bacterium]|nr:hypothetical protein [Gaiellaceae bacterium]
MSRSRRVPRLLLAAAAIVAVARATGSVALTAGAAGTSRRPARLLAGVNFVSV